MFCAVPISAEILSSSFKQNHIRSSCVPSHMQAAANVLQPRRKGYVVGCRYLLRWDKCWKFGCNMYVWT